MAKLSKIIFLQMFSQKNNINNNNNNSKTSIKKSPYFINDEIKGNIKNEYL